VKKNTNVNFKKGWFLSHAVHTALPPIFISKFAEKNVIARLAPQSHCSKANKTASYHEGENLCWALFGQISINAKLREPWQRSPWRRTPSRKKKIMKMSVQLKDTQPNICKLGAQHDARFGCSTGLGTRPVIDDTAPPGVECPMQIAFAFAKRRRNATFAVTNVPARQVNDGY